MFGHHGAAIFIFTFCCVVYGARITKDSLLRPDLKFKSHNSHHHKPAISTILIEDPDVNECDTNNGGCHPQRKCVNTHGSFFCEKCNAGWITKGDTDCDDFNECEVNNGRCDPLTECTNLAGSRRCGTCPLGYDGDGENGCKDINECEEEAVDNAQENSNDDGTTAPQDNSQGQDQKNPPAAPATDANNDGENQSSDNGDAGGGDNNNPPQAQGQGGNVATPAPGQSPPANVGSLLQSRIRKRPLPRNGNGGCDPLVTCLNTPGSRVCGPCPPDYEGDGEIGCSSPDEKQKLWETLNPDLKSAAKLAAEKTAHRTALKMETERAQREAEQQQQQEDEAKDKEVASLDNRVKDLTWKTQINADTRQQQEEQEAAEEARRRAAEMEKEAEQVVANARIEAQRVLDAGKQKPQQPQQSQQHR